MKTSPALLTLALALSLSACQHAPVRDSAATPAPALTPATTRAEAAHHDNLNAVVWMQTSIEYRLLSGQVYRAALNQLDRALKTPDWDALTPDDRVHPATGLPPAVIVDVDETVLDNAAYQARLIRDKASYNEATWADWVREEAATAVPGAVAFAQAAAARGVTVIYLTNRDQSLGPATLNNLRKLGFPVDNDSQFLGLGFFVDGCEQHGSEKGCRRQFVSRSYRVLMQFGDQIGDLTTLLANTPEGREQAIEPYLGWVGERWFVLPNPSYGGWEPALFNNAWSLPEAERRQRKLDALRY